MDLHGKVGLVTGAARRVGRAVALRLAQAGCGVAITFRRSRADADALAGQIEQSGGRAWVFEADFSDTRCIEPLRSDVLAATGRLDVLVHNASVYEATAWGEVDEAAWTRQMTINALSPVLLTQAFAAELAADEGGRVIHFEDIHLMGRPYRGHAAYFASKAALAQMTQVLAVELAPQVTVNAVAPGVVAWAEGASEAQKQAYLERIPLQRPGTVDDAARAVLYLARDADYVTGQTIRVDGGRWLG